MRRTRTGVYKMPKNMGVAPRFDTWNEQYEPWQHMRRMARLVGTGFYIPPEWYNHFRMFPPINHNFQQEKTLNPRNASEPTQDDTDTVTQERVALRDELARKSRLVASEGMRYYNIFWVRKPLDRMEKEYYNLKRKGVPHDDAMKRVLQGFYDELSVKKRIAAIQAEEAKLSGRFITMREASVVLGVLAKLHKEKLTPHQVALLAKEQKQATQTGGNLTATISRTSMGVESKDSTQNAEEGVSPDVLANILSEDNVPSVDGTKYQVEIKEVSRDSVRQLSERASDQLGCSTWYTGASPTYSGS
ncbi:hypothetical protein TRVL_01073 [Trypanosoma vivax]|uniref:Uncharacterized protein n=1 Tax=Trypanosoma vivax (strain Y486) TaxID=1055687 RepID=G0TVC5_TRYVY|nr:hypothetical protein TRVL_01073 [Trypanosoma vivax]CCC47891.1 conserved hypothetical protein [Trypanosoma vivax Y486]